MRRTAVSSTHKTRFTWNKWLHVPCLLAAATFIGTAVAQSNVPARFPVKAGQVVAAMELGGLPTAGVHIDLASAMTAKVAEPQLEVRGVYPSGAHKAQLRLACKDGSECIPFFVTAEWPADVEPKGALALWKGNANGAAPSVSAQPSREQAIAAVHPSIPSTLRAGSHVTLLLDGGKVHIRVTAVCLEKGSVGEKIRVATPDRKQIFTAEVVDNSVLKGSL